MQPQGQNGSPFREEGHIEEGHISLRMDETENARERRRTTEFERGIDPSVKAIPGLRDAVLSKKSFVAPSGDESRANLVCKL